MIYHQSVVQQTSVLAELVHLPMQLEDRTEKKHYTTEEHHYDEDKGGCHAGYFTERAMRLALKSSRIEIARTTRITMTTEKTNAVDIAHCAKETLGGAATSKRATAARATLNMS